MKKIIVANWKMNPESAEKAKKLFSSIDNYLSKKTEIFRKSKVVICPPFVYLGILKKKSKIELGAQNCFFKEKGAFTGEVSPLMLKNMKCKWVILGHSERRKIFKENDKMIKQKLKSVLSLNLYPILCVGETKKERKTGETFQVLKKQVFLTLRNTKYLIRNTKLTIAYEPIWAIGTGIPCQPNEAEKILNFLKERIKTASFLYGGSVKANNVKDFINVGFDGVLVGEASLKDKEFIKIVEESIV
jgi:triosephosphate isomerase